MIPPTSGTADQSEGAFKHTASLLTLLSFLLLFPAEARGQTFHMVEGMVLDAVSGLPLPSANIQLAGTSRGTIANREGAYLMRVAEGPCTLVFSYVGYLSDTLRVDLRANREYDARLEPTLLELPPLTVSGDDIARAVIKRAIEVKDSLNVGLESYRFQAFTRRSIMREDSLAGITEGYSYGYWREGESLKEQLRQYKATENLPDMSMVQGVLDIVDFSRDDLELAGQRYIGPLHPRAFRWYDYTLEDIKFQDGVKIWQIAMEPRNRLVPLLRGTVEIADSTYAMVGVDLVPAEKIVFPFVDDLQVHWNQSFRKQEEGYWLPTHLSMDGGARVGIGPIHIPRIGFSQTAVIYDYDINIAIPDSIFGRSELVALLPESANVDTTFWEENEVLPLTNREERAYTDLDSTQTLEKLFAPPGFEMDADEDSLTLRGGIGAGGELTGKLLQFYDFRYNRVEGAYHGIRASVDSVAGLLEIGGRAGYGLSADRWSWELSINARIGVVPAGPNQPGRRGTGLGLSIYDRTARSPSAGFYPPLLNTLSTILAKDDYFDYHSSRGWRLDLEPVDRSSVGFSLFFAREEHGSLDVTTNWSLSERDLPSRSNPPVSFEDATWSRLGARVRLGRPESMASISPGKGISISAERGTTVNGPGLAYTRADGVASYSISTFTSRYLFSPMLVVRAGGGWSTGDLPREMWGAPENALGIYCPLGALRGSDHREFAGTRYAVVTAEHNFRSLPFQILGMRWFYERGIELLVHAGVAQSWRGEEKIPLDGPYLEAGFGVGRIAELLRVDLTRRLTDRARWYLTLTLTTFL